MKDPNTTLLAFFSVIVGSAALILIANLPRPTRMTTADVAANAGQLAELARRTRVSSADAAAPTHVTYTFAGPCGAYQGLAVVPPWTRHNEPAAAETVLWFSADPHASRLLRNPRRRPLPALTLTRNDLNSDLVPPGSGRRLRLDLRLNTGVAAGEEARFLTLSNERGRADRASATGMNRSLAALTRSAHCKLSERDLATLTLLARILRARVCDEAGSAPTACYPTSLTLFRQHRPGRFGIHLRRADNEAKDGAEEEPELAAFTLAIRYGEEGAPERGEVELVPGVSNLARPAALLFLRPQPPGRPPREDDPAAVEVRYTPGGGEGPGALRTVDFTALLSETGWLQP